MIYIPKYHTVFIILLGAFLAVLSVSCNNYYDPAVYEKGTNEYTNSWILEQMKRYYLWNENLPENTSLSLKPEDYFKEMLYKGDRFSYAVYPSLPETAPQSIRNSYGFDISFAEYDGQTYGVILYVLADSPAERAGLKRGLFIKSINGTSLSSQNFENLYEAAASSSKLTLQLMQYSEADGFSDDGEIEIIRGFTFSNPISSKAILYENQKVGYIEISHFDIGLAGSLLSVFREFQNQSISKIIVDLRYNGGGDVSSAVALSIILAPNIKSDDLFITFRGNKNGGVVNKTFKEALVMNETQVSFEALRAVHPPIQEIFILTGSHTASASEIIINNLKPYMKVIVIGEKTVGKDVAGFAVEDNRISGERGWVLYPVIYKLFNAHNEGSYALGINPDIEINELQNIEVFPLGDIQETVLNKALNNRISAKGQKSMLVKKLTLHKTYDIDPFVQINSE
ncbi:S41 family peptidase [Flavobacterium ginsenosidimutans]|uniref:S41 family peptidase n=1 Tax=Flavobacterium ginsenosidimutans TaxID=687844 RepID=UPI000DAF44B4|nr:S41 family peptidase [Flavobacterium ginsenosidimutans]KAF2328157.1 peptidase S41 [Flavobacterium ginsenosidimutans]